MTARVYFMKTVNGCKDVFIMSLQDEQRRRTIVYSVCIKDIMQGKLFQRCTHFLYCSVLSLGGKVNTRRMSQPEMESFFTKIIYELFLS